MKNNETVIKPYAFAYARNVIIALIFTVITFLPQLDSNNMFVKIFRILALTILIFMVTNSILKFGKYRKTPNIIVTDKQIIIGDFKANLHKLSIDRIGDHLIFRSGNTEVYYSQELRRKDMQYLMSLKRN